MSDTSNPAHIERDLDETRSRLGAHLNELQDRLSPGQVLDDLMGYFRGTEGAAFGQNLVANIRANPMPAALTGIGIAWLMASNPRTSNPDARRIDRNRSSTPSAHLYGSDDHDVTMMRVRDAEQGVLRLPDEAEHDYSARLDDARGQAVGLARHTQESGESFGARVRAALAAAQDAVASTAGSMRDQIGDATGAAGDAIGSLTTSVQDTAQGALRIASGAVSQGGQAAGRAGGNLITAFTESPVLLGAVGLAAGALLGALLPQSEQEEAALGGIAGQVRDTATDVAKEGMERGKRVAQTVADRARESADAHGLTGDVTAGQVVDAALSGKLAQSAREVAGDVLRTGDEAVRGAVDPTIGSPQSSSTNPR